MSDKTFERYKALWPAEYTPLQVEMACIRSGGTWKWGKRECGKGLPYHYGAMRKILWPNLDVHRWHDLCLSEIRRPGAKVTVLMGCAASGKTHEASWNYLCEYFCYPDDLCLLVCSTDIRGLRKRVWGEISTLWQEAKDRFEWLPGHYMDQAIAIATDELKDMEFEERRVRDMRRGIFGVPCRADRTFTGLKDYHGIHPPRMRLIADEAAMMGGSFLASFANLNTNVSFEAIVIGNPNDPLDPLGKAAEPVDGWTNHMSPTKTTVWNTSFYNGRCVNLIGTDSPNFDFPADQPTRYPYLVSREKIEATTKAYGRDSFEVHSQCIGDMIVSGLSRRVITHDMCRAHNTADSSVFWADSHRTKIYGVDAAYGGDRCVGGWIEFGKNTTGEVILLVHRPNIIPVSVKAGIDPEDQIAEYIYEDCQRLEIPPQNMYHDSTGRGNLGSAIAAIWSAEVTGIEFGGAPTERPVSLDIFVWDESLRQRRLKTCKEHYAKFVTELWFSVRLAIEADQLKGLPIDVEDEGCMREWNKATGDRKELESKIDMKLRVGFSPDLFDWLAICVEGARRHGFMIKRLANDATTGNNGYQWLFEMHRARRELIQKSVFTR